MRLNLFQRLYLFYDSCVTELIIKVLMLIFGLYFLPLEAASLTVVFEHNPPFQMIDSDGIGHGAVYDFSKKLLKYAKLDASFEGMPWARIIQKEINHPNRLILSITKTELRSENFIWLIKVYSGRQYVWKKANKQDPKRILVAMERNSHKATGLKSYFQEKNVVEFLDSEQALAALVKNYVQRYVGTTFAVHGKLAQLGYGMGEVERRELFDQYNNGTMDLYLALTKGSSVEIYNRLNTALEHPEILQDVNSLLLKFEQKEKDNVI